MTPALQQSTATPYVVPSSTSGAAYLQPGRGTAGGGGGQHRQREPSCCGSTAGWVGRERHRREGGQRTGRRRLATWCLKLVAAFRVAELFRLVHDAAGGLVLLALVDGVSYTVGSWPRGCVMWCQGGVAETTTHANDPHLLCSARPGTLMCLATPKSAILMRASSPSCSSRMFSG